MSIRKSVAIFAVVLVSGCAGLEIKSLGVDNANEAHTSGNEVDGYIVYHPMVVVEVGEKELCIAKNKKGQCVKVKTVCGIGQPMTMPDYSKPYLITPKSGLGKAGVDVKIEEGWRLGSIKDESDNTELLGVLSSAAGIDTESSVPSESSVSGCEESGLYQLIIEEKGMDLSPLMKY